MEQGDVSANKTFQVVIIMAAGVCKQVRDSS
jgi:hypothetical protein